MNITGRRERSQGVGLLLCLLLSLGALLGTAHIAQAQERTGTLSGMAKDASGGVLPGVTVTITNNRTGRVTTVVTDGAGMYRADLDPGIYKIHFELAGFAPMENPEVQVELGRQFNIDAALKVGNLNEAVQVTAENSPLVDTRSTLIAHNVTAEEIDRLPKGRSFQSIALTAPSVNSGEIEGGFQVNGASGAENAFTVDGVVTTSLVNGASRQNTVFEYIQEVQVKTAGIPAEYGGALGGVISAVTKSGGNIFTGETHYYFDGSMLSAGPVKRLVLSPIDDKTVSYVQDAKMPDIRHEFGGSVGGPIMKDRLFFFGSFSPRINTRTNDYLFANGTEPGDHQTHDQAHPRFWQGQHGQPPGQRLRHRPRHAVVCEGHAPAYNGIRTEYCSPAKAANEPQQDARLGADASEHHWQRRRRRVQRRLSDPAWRLLPRPVQRYGYTEDHKLDVPDGPRRTDERLRRFRRTFRAQC